jgi:hypothetical protein
MQQTRRPVGYHVTQTDLAYLSDLEMTLGDAFSRMQCLLSSRPIMTEAESN